MTPMAAFIKFVLVSALVVDTLKSLSIEALSQSTTKGRGVAKAEARTCEIDRSAAI